MWKPVALAAAFAFAACAPSPKMPPSARHALLDKPLPTFQRSAVSGAPVDTAKTKGSVVVVKLFAKYCEPCKHTLPIAQQLHVAHPDVVFIGVAEDEQRADVEETVAQYGLTFPVVHDGGNVLSGRFRVSDLPATFVADRSGTIRWVGLSTQSETALRDAVVAALND